MARAGHGETERDLRRLLPLIVLCGAILAAAECLYHRLGPAPLGPLRHDGAYYPAFLAIYLAALLVLPVPLVLAVRRGGRALAGLVWFLALFPTVWVYLDHLARFSHWPLLPYHHPSAFVAVTGILAIAVSAGGARLLLIPSWRWLGSPLSSRGSLWLLFLALSSLWLFALPVPPQVEPETSAPPGAPCLLLLSIDTLRADDAASDRAPFLQELAASGVSAEGWSSSPWTSPSVASLFSGVAPTGHGSGRGTVVDPGVDWWPERLARAGWKTKAVVSNPHLERGLGFGRGFDDYNHSSHLERLEPAAQMVWVRWLHRMLQERLDRGDRIIQRAVSWLGRDLRRPWFLWVHLIDPHLPYHPRGPQGQVRDTGDRAWLEPLEPWLERGAVRDLRRLREDADSMDAPTRDALREIYRREISFVDSHLARLFEAAREAAGERDLYWVLTSDHGEEFFDHGGLEHGHTLYRELLRVPMIVGGPGLPRGTHAGALRLEDLGPTLFSLMDLPPMELHSRGRDAISEELSPYAFGEDRSRMLVESADADSCPEMWLVGENLLYGSPRTRLFLPDGRGWLREDEALDYFRLDRCGEYAEQARAAEAQEPEDPAVAIFEALDLWRAAAGSSDELVVDDPAWRQRLKSLGYVQ